MSEIGFRRQGDTTPMYHPERDFAYITPTLLRIAIEQLDDTKDVRKLKWRTDNNIPQAVIAKVVEALAHAQADFVNAADPVASFPAALERHGFYKFSYDVQQYVFATIGEVMVAAWFNAVREVSIKGQESPAAVDMARFSGAVREFCAANGSPTYDASYVAEFRGMQVRDLEFRLKTLDAEYADLKQRYAKLEAQTRGVTGGADCGAKAGCAKAGCCNKNKKAAKPSLFSRATGGLFGK